MPVAEAAPVSVPSPMPAQASALDARGITFAEKLIFEIGHTGQSGVDIAPIPPVTPRLGTGLVRASTGLPGLTEPQAMRHYTRLSQKNYSIDTAFYPLGSCTMKHNPRLNEKMARLAGFADIHPLQPFSTVQGALALMQQLSFWLLQLTGMQAVALSPGAGAQGEFCGMACIKAALAARGEAHRTLVLVPDSAHGTNPATAASLGFQVVSLAADARGRVDMQAFKAKMADPALAQNLAGIMLTNPNTCGLFENDIIEIAAAIHEAGGYFYCDGANFNAIVGRVRPADLGIDAMHINLHKTFSTPHGGGGPGSGPVVLSAALAPFAPVPFVHKAVGGYVLAEQISGIAKDSFGRLKGFHGQMGMFVRALAYMLSHGADGLWQASSDAVLNANYLLARLQDILSAPFAGPCMHEALFDDRCLKDTGLSTLDIAKALIDRGFHPMTMYFPLVVKGAMLIEPTESESKAALDLFIAALTEIMAEIKAGHGARHQAAPTRTPRLRLDETKAARQPQLRWRPVIHDNLPTLPEAEGVSAVNKAC